MTEAAHPPVPRTVPLTDPGAGEEARTLVLVHELGGSFRSFDRLCPHLVRHFQVLGDDQRGAGQAPTSPGAYSVQDLAADLYRQVGCHAPPGRHWVLAAAAGAAVAVEYARCKPDRLAGLILCAPALTVDAERASYLRSRAAQAESGGMQAIAETVLARSYPVACRKDHAAFDQYRAAFLATDPRGYAQANRAFADYPGLADAAPLAVPCLLIAGRHDVLRPPAGIHLLARHFRQARCVDIDSGHLMAWQAPQAVAAQVLAFVATVRTTTARETA